MKSISVPFSSCERDFVLQSIRSRKRLDGRESYDYRKLKISFGIERGHCEVQLGRTRVLGQVSCEVTQPKVNRPTEGQIFVNVELSPMASPAFESGRPTEFGVELNRFMERFYVESRAIDVESLCIVAGEKVWSVRVDLHVLDNGGNIADCASIAAISALAHFRRPDVSVIGEEVTIHSPDDRDPVPLSILHMPVCVTFSFFEEGELLLVDPTDKEEIVMNGRMIMAMNIHREICGAVMDGGVSLESHQILRCSKIASVKVSEILAVIQKALSEDSKQRAIGKTGQMESDMKSSKITVTSAEETDVDITEVVERVSDHSVEVTSSPGEEEEMQWYAELKGPGTAQVGEGGDNMWLVVDSVDDDTTESDEVTITDVKTNTNPRVQNIIKAQKEDDIAVVPTVEIESSEEEDVVVLTYDKKDDFHSSAKPNNTRDTINLNVALKTYDGASNSEKKTKKKKRKSGSKAGSLAS